MTRVRVRTSVIAALIGISALTGCSSQSSGEVLRMWIAPELAECTGVGPMECLQVSYEEGGPTELFYETIDGFTFEEGTSSVIDVRVDEVENPPADGSSLSYTLVEVISQTPQ